MASEPPRDDRILTLTRAVAVVVSLILALACVVLFVSPATTDRRFAWTIAGTMTPMLMGAGYGSALVFFAAVIGGGWWHRVTLGFIPTTVFTWMMLGTTLLHWDRFRHGSAAFQLWFWVYLATPIVVPLVWWRNRPHDPGAIEGDAEFPLWTRRAMVGAGVAMSTIAVWLYVAPSSAIDVWPWPLTELTARAVAAFVALPGVAWLAIAADDRWSAAQVMLATVSVGLVLLLVAVARAWDEFDHGNPWSYVYVTGLVATLSAIGALALFMRARARA